ncbi:MAG TPA: tetratricopeptide repeat protein [Candidatus Acidoferrum sp.]|nr:tetratricopeptide repeat protein [Candidatus Acidoferrum sp.]
MCALVLLCFAIYFAARQGVGAWYFRSGQPNDIEAAIRWDPSNPQYPGALANVMHFYADSANAGRIVRLCETAVSLSPYDAHYWADLGSAYDWAGRPEDALRAFERAHALFPNSSDINWRLANFDIRARRISDGLHLLQSVLLAGGVDERQIFSLATRATSDNAAILREMIPARAPFLLDYLDFQVGAGNIDAAQETWKHLLGSKLPFDLPQALPYLDALIQHRDLDAASGTWNELGELFPAKIPKRTPDGNLITNADFALAVLNGGFDWRVNPAEGAAVTVTPPGAAGEMGSLAIEFDGSRNLEYANVLQLVRVQPRTEYQFSAETRTQGITTDCGPRFQVFDIGDMTRLWATPNRVGTSDWSRDTLNFRTGANTRLLVVRIERPASSKFDNKISGTIWIRRVALVPVAQDVKH